MFVRREVCNQFPALGPVEHPDMIFVLAHLHELPEPAVGGVARPEPSARPPEGIEQRVALVPELAGIGVGGRAGFAVPARNRATVGLAREPGSPPGGTRDEVAIVDGAFHWFRIIHKSLSIFHMHGDFL